MPQQISRARETHFSHLVPWTGSPQRRTCATAAPTAAPTAARAAARAASRSRSPLSQASRCKHTPGKAWSRQPTQVEQLAGELGLTRLKLRGVTAVTQNDIFAVIGPKTQDAFFDLLYKCNIRDLDFEFEQTLDLEVLAAETGPETMPAPHLLNIVLAVLASRDGQQSLSPSSVGPPGGGEGGHGYADDEEKRLRDLEASTQAYVLRAQQRIRELERYRIAAVQGTPFPHHENAPATLNDPVAAAPAPTAAEVATKVRPFITPINPDRYNIRL